MNLFTLGQNFRSGLLRLSKWLQESVFTRRTAVHLLTHLILSLILHTVLDHFGVPKLLAVVVIGLVIVLVETTINDYLNKQA